MKFKLGLKPPSFNPRARSMGKYLKAIPATSPIDMSKYAATHAYVMSAMMANGPDPLAPAKIAPFGVGDCFWAAAVRFAALSALSKNRVLFTSEQDMVNSALDAYAKQTGWDINQTDSQGNNPTDQGTDPTTGFMWLQSVGLLCSDGSRHRFGEMLQIDPTNFAEIEAAFNIAEGIMIGINFPSDWENSPIWDKTSSASVGGHEIPGYSNLKLTTQGIEIDTWGNASPGPRIITPAGLAQQCNQLTVILNPAEFGKHGRRINGKRRKGRNVQGFNASQWKIDIANAGGH